MDAGYVMVFDKDTVIMVKRKIVVPKNDMIQGWRDSCIELYCIPLISEVKNWNTYTVMLNEKESWRMQKMKPDLVTTINNVYELPSREKVIRYLHTVVGYQT